MTNSDIATQHADAIKQLREAARDPIEESSEWRGLRRQLAAEKRQARRRVWEELARTTGLDLAALEKAARRDDRMNQEVLKTLEALEARAVEHAHRRWRHPVDAGEHVPTQRGETALKFRQAVAWYGDAQPSECYTAFAGGGIDYPVYEAGADLTVNDGGAWLHPHLLNKDGDCTSHEDGFTLHEIIYHLPPPPASVHVNGVNVNLHGYGVGNAIEGEYDFDWLNLVSIYFGQWPEGSGFHIGGTASITLDVSMGQYVNGEWQFWPLLTQDLFRKGGDYMNTLQFAMTGRNYPSNFKLRSPAGGGADLLCYVKIRCEAETSGEHHGFARLTFKAPQLGIFVGGVNLWGQFDQPVLEP